MNHLKTIKSDIEHIEEDANKAFREIHDNGMNIAKTHFIFKDDVIYFFIQYYMRTHR